MNVYTYERDADDGKYYILIYGRRSRGFNPSPTEADAKRRIAHMIEEDRQADEADAIYSRMYDY